MIELLDKSGLDRVQRLVADRHYLRRRVDARCSPLAYSIKVEEEDAGCLIFGRPEATRCGDWYGGVDDVDAGRCEVTRWQVLNLARVFILPDYQKGGALFGPSLLPGFEDRSGRWRSTLASSAIAEALNRVVVDYLLARPPCFPDEPFELRWCLSYCDTRYHRGSLYRAAGFELYRTNDRGIQTWRKALRRLTTDETERVIEASRVSPRSRAYRARRAQIAFAF